jgi:hypothetical protein
MRDAKKRRRIEELEHDNLPSRTLISVEAVAGLHSCRNQADGRD